MTHRSSPDLLALHAVRICGFADTDALARRFGLDPAVAAEFLGDAQAWGWVSRTEFAGLGGWSLTESGRAENESRLAGELRGIGAEGELRKIYAGFLPLNARLQRACTDWQLRPVAGDRLATNDHTDSGWDTRVLDELAAIERALGPLVDRLGDVLARFTGYDVRFAAARRRAAAGEHEWVDRSDIDSCHRVWFELHEDLIATLGIDRNSD